MENLSSKVKSYYDPYHPVKNPDGIDTWPTGIFGNFTPEDEADFNRQMAQAQTLAELDIMEYQNFYNSPEQQAIRMRQAGLNPDLQGIENHSSAGASAGTAVAPQGTESINIATSAASTVFSAFNTAMSVVHGMQSFRMAQEDLASQKIDNVNKMDGFALSFLLGSDVFPKSFASKDLLLDDIESRSVDIISSAYDFGRKTYGFNRRQARIFQDSVMRSIKDPRFVENLYASLNSAEKDRQEYISQTTGDLYDQQDATMRIMLDEVIRLQNSLFKQSLNTSRYRSMYDQELYQNLDASSFADSQNILYTDQSSQIRSAYYEKAFGRNIRKRLYSSYKDGNILSGIVLSLIGDAGNSGIKFMNFGPSSFNNAMDFLGGIK